MLFLVDCTPLLSSLGSTPSFGSDDTTTCLDGTVESPGGSCTIPFSNSDGGTTPSGVPSVPRGSHTHCVIKYDRLWRPVHSWPRRPCLRRPRPLDALHIAAPCIVIVSGPLELLQLGSLRR